MTKRQILHELIMLTYWATQKSGIRKNPYGVEEVRRACEVIAKEKGKTSLYDWND